MASGYTFNAQRNSLNGGGFKIIGEQTRENALHAERDRQTVGRKSVARSEGIFNLHGRVIFQLDFAGEMKSGAFSVKRILSKAAESGERNQDGRQAWMIDQLEVKLFLRASDGKGEFQRNHRGRRTQLSSDRGDVIAGNSADRAAHVYDFGGGHLGGESGEQ